MVTVRSASIIVEEELRKIAKTGYTVSKIESQSTNSVYYCIQAQKSRISFRISDHPTSKSKIITLDVSYKTNADKIRRFVANRLETLKKNNLMCLLSD